VDGMRDAMEGRTYDAGEGVVVPLYGATAPAHAPPEQRAA
jgi:hypothetical protein